MLFVGTTHHLWNICSTVDDWYVLIYDKRYIPAHNNSTYLECAVIALHVIGGNLTVKFFPGGFGDVLVWEETALYYSSNKGRRMCTIVQPQYAMWNYWPILIIGLLVDPVQIYTVIETTLAPVSLETDHIKQVSLGTLVSIRTQLHNTVLFERAGQNGRFIVCGGQNRLYYGDLAIGYALEVVLALSVIA